MDSFNKNHFYNKKIVRRSIKRSNRRSMVAPKRSCSDYFTEMMLWNCKGPLESLLAKVKKKDLGKVSKFTENPYVVLKVILLHSN